MTSTDHVLRGRCPRSLVYPRVGGVLYREYKIIVQNRVNLMLGLVPPLLYVTMFATSMSRSIEHVPYGHGLVSYDLFVLPSILVIAMISGATTASSLLFAEEMSGMLDEIFSYPVSRGAFIAARLGVTTVLVLTQGIAMLIVGSVVLGLNLGLPRIGLVIAAIVGSSIALNVFYLFVGSQFKSQQRFLIIMNIATPLATFAAPSFYPYASMPRPLQIVSWIDPVTYGLLVVRGALLNVMDTDGWIGITVLTAGGGSFGALTVLTLVKRIAVR